MSRSTITTPDQPSANDQSNHTEFVSSANVAEDSVRMVAAITKDYRVGRVTVLDGWVLSETEKSLTTTLSG
jgi:hypothetical protein